MRTVVPDWGNNLLERLEAAQHPAREVDVLADLARAESTPWPSGLWLAVDDYHFLTSEPAAEVFLHELSSGSHVNLLICARRRPSWATARRVVYGEILQVGRAALAMTEDETRLVVGEGRAHGETSHMRSGGWPALLGLVALAGADSLDDERLPETIHDYLAEELYGSLGSRTQKIARILAVVAPLNRAVATTVFGEVVDSALTEAADAGLIECDDETIEMHPLIRRFLLTKVAPADEKDLSFILGVLIARHDWDAAFSVVEVALPGRVDDLLRAAVPELLSRSHIQTLETWLRLADDVGVAGEASELVRAELAFREGQYLEAHAIAAAAAALLEDPDELKTRTLLVAGRAAHLASQEDAALHAYRRARALAPTDALRTAGLWGEVSAAVDLELPEAGDLLAVAEAEVSDYVGRVSLTKQRLLYEARMGRIETLDTARSLIKDLNRVRDPLLRASFLNSVAYTLSLVADYRECLRVCDLLLSEAESQRLEFVFSHGLATRAVALAGLRRFDEALDSVAEAQRLATSQGDRHSTLNCEAVKSRIYFSLGRYSDAVDAHTTDPRGAIRAMRSETAACRGLALAALGRLAEAQEESEQATALSHTIESRVIVEGIRTLCAVGEGGAAAAHATEQLVAEAVESGNIDNLLTVCRGAPHVLRYASTPTLDVLRTVLRKSGDSSLHRVVSELQELQRPGVASLSPREQEVGVLVTRGLSNKEIGAALYITPGTAKQHVRRILAKLGVRSRTEAALRLAAAQDQLRDNGE
jgi:ATP/maltotriose-dependent transcriptional regulator MalT